MEKKTVLFLIIIGLVTTAFAVAAATFAYLSSLTVSQNPIKQTIIQTKTYPTTITYDQNKEINIDYTNMEANNSVAISIHNTNPIEAITYYLYWEDVTNSASDLGFYVICNNNANGEIQEQKDLTVLPEKVNNFERLTKEIVLMAKTTHTCSVEIKSTDINPEPNNNENIKFTGTIKVGIK